MRSNRLLFRHVPLIALASMMAGCAHYEARPILPQKTAATLEARSLGSPELKAYLETTLGHEINPWPRKEWDFETLTWVAFHYHPSLDVARAQWAAASAGITTAAARPNPTVSVSPGYNFTSMSGVSPWFPAMTVDVPLETAGKRSKRIAHQELLSEAAKQDVFTSAWKVRSDLRKALIDLVTVDARAQLLQRQAELQRGALDLLNQRLEAGDVSAADVSAERLLWIQSDIAAAEAKRQAELARGRLAEALGLPLAGLASQHFADSLNQLPKPMSEQALSEARSISLQNRPGVLASLARYEASQAALRLEIAKQYPDIHLGSGYQWDQGSHKWDLSVTLDLPLLNHNEGPIAEAEANRRVAAAEFVAVQAKVIAEIDAAIAAQSAATRQIADLDRLQQELEAATSRTRARLEAGDTDRFAVQSAQIEQAANQVALLDARSAAASAVGQLEDALRIPVVQFSAALAAGAASDAPHKP